MFADYVVHRFVVRHAARKQDGIHLTFENRSHRADLLGDAVTHRVEHGFGFLVALFDVDADLLHGVLVQVSYQTAFAGESQAHTKYEYYASQAKKDGYEQIAALFLETSHNEKEHAKIWFKYLHGGEMPETLPNLEDAAAGHNDHRVVMSLALLALAAGLELSIDDAEAVQKSWPHFFEAIKPLGAEVEYAG